MLISYEINDSLILKKVKCKKYTATTLIIFKDKDSIFKFIEEDYEREVELCTGQSKFL